jgi:hypothetical protein
MLSIPAMAAPEQPVGTVIQAKGAHLGNAEAVLGADVFPGDALDTDIGGSLRLSIGSGQLYILSSSAAALAQQAGVVRASITRGTAGFSSLKAGEFELDTPIATLRPANGESVFGQVTIKGPEEMVVSVYRGSVIVERGGEERAVTAGTAYNVSLEPAPGGTSGPPKAGVTPSFFNRKLLYRAIVVASVGVASYFLWDWLTESNSDPRPAH